MKQKLLYPVILGLVALAFMLGSLVGLAPVEAAPGAVPTPAFTGYSGDNVQNVTFWSSQTITNDRASTAFELAEAEALDIQYTIDQTVVANETNTTTLKLQFSNDGTNWTDGVAIVTANAADVTNLLQFNNFGRYTRVYADGNANNLPYVVTLIAVGRR